MSVQTEHAKTNEVLDAKTLKVGRYAYVAAIGANAVAVIDVSTLSVVNMLPAGKQPWGVLVM